MYCVEAVMGLVFPPFIEKGDFLTMDENMEVLDGDLIYLQSSSRTSVGFYNDLMQLKEGVTAHAIVNINRPIKDDEATRQARLKRVGVL